MPRKRGAIVNEARSIAQKEDGGRSRRMSDVMARFNVCEVVFAVVSWPIATFQDSVT